MTDFDYRFAADPKVFSVNCLQPHSDHIPLAPQDDPAAGMTSLRCSLNGMWKFHYSENYESAPQGFEKPDFDVSGWKEIPVPSNMQMEGYDAPAYVNTQYPWDGVEDVKPGQIPERSNPTGQYVRFFTLPDSWKEDRVRISFQGVQSGFAFWLNGSFIGYREDSFSPAEFDLTPYLKEGENRIAVLVFKWTSGSWCEDQDMYRLSGIFRDVYLERLPKVHLEDIRVIADLKDQYNTGLLDVTLKLSGDLSNTSLDWSLEKIGVVRHWEDLRAEHETVLSGHVTLDNPAQAAVSLREELSWPLAWSAEEPNLYQLVVTVRDGQTVMEFVRELIGFRHFEMKDGIMCLNGKRIVFNGVNRHEFSCDRGRSPQPADVLHDLTVMKQNNINAVRTCHYPDASIIYRLCDILGLYMIAENNMETHGVWDRIIRGELTVDQALPGDREDWKDLLMDRLHSMFELEKNHPSILIWSVGNEAFGGSVIYQMSEEFRRLDHTRLVHYEGIFNDRRYPGTSDMESQMYTPVNKVEAFLRANPEKPFIMCEYSHSMGNSNGGLFKYTDLAKREPRYQGGFIWDFIDQAVRMKNRYGEEFMGYGGDNHERPTDYEFSGNGIVDAGRRPYNGKIQEIKFCYQNIDAVFEAYENAVRMKITNRNLFVSTSEYICNVRMMREGRSLKCMCLETDVKPGQTEIYSLPFTIPATGEYVISAEFTLKENMLWGRTGDVTAWGENVFQGREEKFPSLTDVPVELTADGSTYCLNGIRVLPVRRKPEMEVVRGGVNLGVRGEHFSVLFNGLKGGLVSYRFGGKEMIEQIPRPNFWRAPTNNDEGNQMAARYGIWKTASLYQHFMVPDVELFDPDEDAFCYPRITQTKEYLEIAWKKYFLIPMQEKPGFVLTTYRVFPDGTVRLILTYDPEMVLSPMPEFGWLFALDADYCHVKYYGMGPEENYCDRRKGSRLGVYHRDAEEMVEPYLVPQETGNRTGVRWAEVTDRKGHGVRFTAAGFEDCGDSEASRPGTMEFSAIPYSPEMLEAARHPYELPKVQYTWVRCSLKQMGVGGDDSWGARTHEEFLLKNDRKLSFAVDFKGI